LSSGKFHNPFAIGVRGGIHVIKSQFLRVKAAEEIQLNLSMLALSRDFSNGSGFNYKRDGRGQSYGNEIKIPIPNKTDIGNLSLALSI